MSTLYELGNEYEQLLMIAEDPDVDPQVLADTMEALEGEIEKKADGCARAFRKCEGPERRGKAAHGTSTG